MASVDDRNLSPRGISEPIPPPYENDEAPRSKLRRLTWEEAYREVEAERQRMSTWTSILMDLNRCEHGRHEGDVCSSCGGPSHGNPLVREDRVIGYSLEGKPIRIPEGHEFYNDPANWKPCSTRSRSSTH